MRNVSHWTLGGRSDRPATRLRCGSQLSHNLKLFPYEKRESLFLAKGAEGGGGRRGWFRCPCGLRVRNARRSNKKKGAHTGGKERGGGPSGKGPRAINTRITICDERPSSAPFSYPCGHDVRTCIYFLHPPPPFLTLSSLTLCIIRLFFSLSLVVYSLYYVSSCTSSLFFFPDPRAHLFLSLVQRRSRFSSARQGIPCAVFFFLRESMREHAAPSWGACINIRLIMLDATITGPVGHRCVQVGSPARATVKFPCPNTMFNLYPVVVHVTELVFQEMRRIANSMRRIR